MTSGAAAGAATAAAEQGPVEPVAALVERPRVEARAMVPSEPDRLAAEEPAGRYAREVVVGEEALKVEVKPDAGHY